MNLLFIHEAFPAQFGRLGLELAERHGWNCRFLIRSVSSCPTPSDRMLERLELRRIPVSESYSRGDPLPWPRIYAHYLELCGAVAEGVRSLPGPPPDLVVAHGGRGAPVVFLPDLLPATPIISYCEYYFALARRDISYRVDLPPAEPAAFFPRTINAPTLVSLIHSDAGYSATRWQRDSFPERFRPQIEVHFDGIDDQLYQPGPGLLELAGRSIGRDTKVVTYVARGLESVRGFDLFIKVAERIARERSDVLFVVVGGDATYYGWDRLHTGHDSFQQWVLDQHPALDRERFVFTGQVAPEPLAGILRRSDLHLYLTVPFVLSWSLLNAMACGAVVLASDVEPVREILEPGVHGLVEPLFDVDRLAETALRVLADPAGHAPLGRAARRRVEAHYSLDVAVPALKDYFERVAAAGVVREF